MFDEHARHGEKVEYGASNPHPLFGKDPNIMNEKGHTLYPKWVDHPTDKRVDHIVTNKNNNESVSTMVESKHPVRVLVQDADEEAELLGRSKPSKSGKEWAGK